MKADELRQALREGRVGYDDNDFEDESSWPYLAYVLWNNEEVTLDGKPIEVVYDLELGEDRGAGHDGQPLKIVVRIGNDFLVAMGQYESWDGEHFPEGLQDAQLVNVPTWLPVGLTPEHKF